MAHRDAAWDLIVKALARYGKIEAACDATGFPAQTVYNRRSADPAFKRLTDEALARHKGRSRKEVVDLAWPEDDEGNPKPREWGRVFAYDQQANREDYVQTVRHEHAVYFFDVPDTPTLPAPTLRELPAETEDE